MIRRNVFAVAVLGTSMVAGSALGEDYSQRALLKSRSLSTGMPNATAPLLARNAGSMQSTKAALFSSLCGTCQKSETVSPTRTHVEGVNWVLDIEGDGTQASYRLRDGEARSSQLGAPSASRMSKDALESVGRAFIAAKLAGVIVLGLNEQLVALTAAYRIEGGQDLNTKTMAPDMVVANRVLFGRTINGVPVVGGGSTVAVTFANDGSVESFRYDWPSYSSTSTQRAAASPREIVGRVQQIMAARSSQLNVATPLPASMSSYPVTIAPQAQLQDLECGYFDPGLSRRDPKAAVQAGCTYHVVETLSDSAGNSRSAHGGAVPAGAQIEADAAWPEIVLLTKASVKVQPPSSSPSN